jgi:lantibiotic transport system permease protein
MLLRTLSAETLKYRRTSAFFLALVVPVTIHALLLAVYAFEPSMQRLPLEGRWNLFLKDSMNPWIQLFLPLGLGILAALALSLEHSDNQWKHVLVLGPSRVTVYLAKCLAVVTLVLLGSLALALSGLVVGGFVTGFQKIPWADVFRGPALTFVGALGMISVQTWLATRFKAFGTSIGVALLGAFIGGFAAYSPVYWRFVPWAYPFSAFGSRVPDNELAMLLSVGVAVVVTALAAWDFSRRDML